MELICHLPTELPASATAPEWLMYAPAGEHKIKASCEGKPKEVRVLVDKAAAARLQQDLSARLAAKGKTGPFFDFHHQGLDASAYPNAFEWRDEGIFAKVEWSPAGAAAVTCGAGQKPAVRFFSPRCNFDEKTGKILGLMPASTGNAAGGIVSDPAFETISALTARKAAAQAAEPNNTDMNTTLLATLVAQGLLTETESKLENVNELVASKVTELKKSADKPAETKTADPKVTELAASLATTQSELKAMKEKAADRFVNELCASGKIPPQAAGLKKMWRASYLADPDQAEKDAKELKAAKALDPNPLTDDADSQTDGSDGSGMSLEASKTFYAGVAAKQKSLMQANKDLDAHAAWLQAEGELKAARATANA